MSMNCLLYIKYMKSSCRHFPPSLPATGGFMRETVKKVKSVVIGVKLQVYDSPLDFKPQKNEKYDTRPKRIFYKQTIAA